MIQFFRYHPYTRYRKGVLDLEALVSFLIAVAAGVVSRLISKWLDDNK